MTNVRIPPVLRTETDGRRDVEIAGDTVREVLDGLVSAFPGLDGRLLAEGQPQPFVNLFLDGADVRTLDGLETAVGPDSTLLLLPAMAGGAQRPRSYFKKYSVTAATNLRAGRRRSMSAYATDVLVTTDWLSEHLDDPGLVVAEVDEDPALYDEGHIRGAVKLHWRHDLQDPVERDLIRPEAFEALLGRLGIANETTVVLYGDKNNWFAAYAYWYLKIYGHEHVRILDGGRQKWVDEGRELTGEVPARPRTDYSAKPRDESIRVYRDAVLAAIADGGGTALVDVRSPQEFTGELIAPPGYEQEGAQRAGHIPTAQSIPWSTAVRDDGTFKPADELRTIYVGKGVTPEKEVLAYCRIGERSAHTWFVLRELLGYGDVKNYDGSWTEWGNLVDVPIEKGAAQAAPA